METLGNQTAGDGEEFAVRSNGGDWLTAWHSPMEVPAGTPHGANAFCVTADDQVVLITDHGKVIRLKAKQVRITGRNAQGVHMVKLEAGEKLRAIAPLAEREDDEDGNGGNGADSNGGGEKE